MVDKARIEADAVRAAAQHERNLTIEGAISTRERILDDLSRRRRVASVQIEQLRAGRERLLESYGGGPPHPRGGQRRAQPGRRRSPGRRRRGGPAHAARPAIPIRPGRRGRRRVPARPPRRPRPRRPSGEDGRPGRRRPAPDGRRRRGPPPEPPVGRQPSSGPVARAARPPACLPASRRPIPPGGSPRPRRGGRAGPRRWRPRSIPSRTPAPGRKRRPPRLRWCGRARPGRDACGRSPTDDAGAGSQVDVRSPVSAPAGPASRPPGRGPAEEDPVRPAAGAVDAEPSPDADRAGTDAGEPTPATERRRATVARIRPTPTTACCARRQAVLADLESSLTRKLKRALQDEQNDLLDRLRSLRGEPTVAPLLPGLADQIAHYAGVARPRSMKRPPAGVALRGRDPRAAGRRAPEPARPTSATWPTEAATTIVESLRRRLEHAISTSAGDEQQVLVEAVGSAYREWKSERIERIAGRCAGGGLLPGDVAPGARRRSAALGRPGHRRPLPRLRRRRPGRQPAQG